MLGKGHTCVAASPQCVYVGYTGVLGHTLENNISKCTFGKEPVQVWRA